VSAEPLGTVLLFSGVAALAAGLGAVPYALGRPPTRGTIGWANALAGGLMLGVAYALLTEGLGDALVAPGMGALAGLAFVRGTHAATGTGELDLEEVADGSDQEGYKAILVDALHAADEGIAIGVAMAASLPLGIATALTLAVHNVPEAMVLNAALGQRGYTLPKSAAIAVAVNVNQILLAVVAFSLVGQWPVLLPAAAGFAVGALIYRTLVELLPESYHQAGETSIAVVTLVALGVVVLFVGGAA